MIRIELEIGSQIYRFASESLDYGGYYWEGRINNKIDIQRVFSFVEKTGNRKRSLSITLDNSDSMLTQLHYDFGLLNRKITIYFNDGINLTQKMTGNIVEIPNADKTINITITEKNNLYFDQPIPDAQIAYDYYSENGFNENWNAIPIIFGNVRRLRVAWVDKVNYRFMIGSGELYRINKVYFDKQVIYDAETSLNGYQPTPESKNIKVRVYRGSFGEVVDTIPSAYPNFAYIEFYDGFTGDYIEPMMTDGKIPEIYVDVSGVINDARNGPERNPCRILHKLLTYPITGFNGWGLEVPAMDLNFNEAIAWCDLNEIFIDGVIDRSVPAGEWIDQFCKHSNTALVEDNGILTLVVDKRLNSVSAAFDESGELGYHCNIEGFREPALDAQVNRHRLFYRYNYEFDNFDRKPDINEESPCKSSQLRNEDHYIRINQWNTNKVEFPWFYDDEPAHKIAQLYFKRDILQLKTITFIAPVDVPSSLDVKQKITVTSTRFGWSQKEFTIQEILKGESNTRITAKEYDSNVYTSVLDLTPVENVRDEFGKYDIPPKPKNLLAIPTTTPNTDGTLSTVVYLAATKLTENISNILFYRKKDGETNWQYFASTETSALNFLWDREDGNYYIRAVSRTPYGVCSNIEILSGDTHYFGQPGAETTLAINRVYTTVHVPDKPIVGVHFKTVNIRCQQGATKSADLVAFEIHRAVSPYEVWSKVGEIACSGTGSLVYFYDESTSYGITYKYKIRSINSSGYYSSFSEVSDAITTKQVESFDMGPLSVALCNLQACSVDNSKIVDCAIQGIKLVDCAITCTKIADNAITTPKIAANAVTACTICANAITSEKIAALAVISCTINTCAITTDKLAVNAVTADKILACQISAVHVGTNLLIANGANIGCAVICNAHIECLSADKITTGTMQVGSCITSQSYASGTSGWIINSNGSAEFNNNVTIRGTVYASAGCFTGTVNASSGCFTGTITSCCGSIGGWTINSGYISANCTSWSSSGLYPYMQFYNGGGGQDYLTIGRYLWGGYCAGVLISWEGNTGISYVDNNTCLAFQLSSGRKYIAGWSFDSSTLYNSSGCNVLALASTFRSIYTHLTSNANYGEWHGQIYNNGAWTGRYGFAVTRGLGVYLFRSDTDSSGGNACNMISNFNFNESSLWMSQVTASATDAFTISPAASGNIICLCSTSISGYNSGIAYICAKAGSGKLYLYGNTSTIGDFGLFIVDAGSACMLSASKFSGTIMDLRKTNCSDGCVMVNMCNSTQSTALCVRTNYQIPVDICAYYANTAIRAMSTYDYGGYFCSGGVYGIWACSGSSYGVVGTTAGYYGVYGAAGCQYGGYFVSATWPSLYASYGAQICSNLDICGGGINVWSGVVCATGFCLISRREYKKDFTEIANILPSIKSLPMVAFKYKTTMDDKWHFGPMAEDFQKSFPWLGDGNGVPLLDRLAIKGVQELDEQVIKISSAISDIDKRLKNIENILSKT